MIHLFRKLKHDFKLDKLIRSWNIGARIKNINLLKGISIFMSITCIIYLLLIVGLRDQNKVNNFFYKSRLELVDNYILIILNIIGFVLYYTFMYKNFMKNQNWKLIDDVFKEIIYIIFLLIANTNLIIKIENELIILFLIMIIYICILTIYYYLYRIIKIICNLKKESNLINYGLYNICYKYKLPSIIFFISVIIILIITVYAFIYYNCYIEMNKVTNGNVTQGIYYNNNIVKSFFDLLYFSSVTFFTVGYGDLLPIGNKFRLLVQSEMFMGYLLSIILIPLVMVLINEIFSKKTNCLDVLDNNVYKNLKNMIEIPVYKFNDYNLIITPKIGIDLSSDNYLYVDMYELNDKYDVIEEIKNYNGFQKYFFIKIDGDFLNILNIKEGDLILIKKKENDDVLNDDELILLEFTISKKIYVGIKENSKQYRLFTDDNEVICSHPNNMNELGKVISIRRSYYYGNL